VRVARLDQFEHASAKALPRFRRRRRAAELRDAQGIAHVILDPFVGEGEEIALG
jgi:hypothetical protein